MAQYRLFAVLISSLQAIFVSICMLKQTEISDLMLAGR
jgi:hypothetical protein